MNSHRARVEFYGTRTCGFCHAAERLLTEKGITYRREDVTGDPARRRWLFEASGRRTVPQIFINGRPIGGYTDLAALESTGRLDEMLATPPLLDASSSSARSPRA
jgi:glutaredoxin 3